MISSQNILVIFGNDVSYSPKYIHHFHLLHTLRSFIPGQRVTLKSYFLSFKGKWDFLSIVCLKTLPSTIFCRKSFFAENKSKSKLWVPLSITLMPCVLMNPWVPLHHSDALCVQESFCLAFCYVSGSNLLT